MNIEKLDQFLTKLLETARWQLVYKLEPEEEHFKVKFSGEDAPILLGHQADTLRALEYILNRVFEKAGRKIILDCNDYRALREQELRMMAQVAAERVKRLRKPHKFSPMAPDERRIIHLAVAEDPEVRTESEGLGENRKVVIYPK